MFHNSVPEWRGFFHWQYQKDISQGSVQNWIGTLPRLAHFLPTHKLPNLGTNCANYTATPCDILEQFSLTNFALLLQTRMEVQLWALWDHLDSNKP